MTIAKNNGFATVDHYFELNRRRHVMRVAGRRRAATRYLWGQEFIALSLSAVKALQYIHNRGLVVGEIKRDSLLLRWNGKSSFRRDEANIISAKIRGFSRMRKVRDLPQNVRDAIHPMYIPGTPEKDAFDLFLVLMELHGFYTKPMQDFRAKLLATDQYLQSTAPRKNSPDMLSSWDEYHLSTLHLFPLHHASSRHAANFLT